MPHLFLNGPVQNGPFTFDMEPGKAVGIRLASALNAIVGGPIAPHLWNTVTLDGDLRYRESSGTSATRRAFEADLIAAKYPAGKLTDAGLVTDNDGEVRDLALEMIDGMLRSGSVAISRESVPTCRRCGHMTGGGMRRCRACGSADTVNHASLQLVAEFARDRPVLDRSDVHASHRQPPRHLQKNVGNIKGRLILSRTRDYGIDLAPIGLPGLVLDPRAGVHVTALAVARRFRADTAVMTITQNAANHIAAYGQHFRVHRGSRLRYALHGHLPYDDIAAVRAIYEAHSASTETRSAFETWFLPLVSLKEKNGTPAGQLPALFKHFIRTRRIQPTEAGGVALEATRLDIIRGKTDWITNKPKLAAAMAAATEAPYSDSL